MNTNNNIKVGIGQTMIGRCKVASVDARTGETKWESDWTKNLILNQGMNQIATDTIASMFEYGIAGTGSRPNSISGGDSTITQSGATVRLSPVTGLQDFTSSVMSASYDYYSACAQVGDMLKYSNTSESMVTAVDPNGLNLTVTPSLTFTDENTFTIWKTSQRGLEKEIKRSNTYLTNWPNCGEYSSSITSSTRGNRRTFDFTSESVARTYTEIGTSWAGTVTGSNVFNRIVLPIPITIDVDFKLRLVYDLQITVSPSEPVYFTASIGGWPHPLGTATNTIATQSIQRFRIGFVNSSTGTTTDSYNALEPYSVGGSTTGNFNMWASSDSQSLSAFGSATLRDTNVVQDTGTSKSTYIANSFYFDKTGVFEEGELNLSNIRSIGAGGYYSGASTKPYDTVYQAFCVLFNEPQLKLDTQKLSITFRHSWARVLG